MPVSFSIWVANLAIVQRPNSYPSSSGSLTISSVNLSIYSSVAFLWFPFFLLSLRLSISFGFPWLHQYHTCLLQHPNNPDISSYVFPSFLKSKINILSLVTACSSIFRAFCSSFLVFWSKKFNVNITIFKIESIYSTLYPLRVMTAYTIWM